MRHLAWLAIGLSSFAAACASPAPAHHPSAANREKLALEEESAARAHLEAAETPPRRGDDRCGKAVVSKTISYDRCWEQSREAHRAEAAEHFKLARSHREALRELREAADRTCSGLSSEERATSPFAHSTDVLMVGSIGVGDHVDGARIVFRKRDGLTRAHLQQWLDCHVADADARGHELPDEDFCPLNPPDVVARARETANGIVVDVTSNDPDAAREVLRRALALTSH